MNTDFDVLHNMYGYTEQCRQLRVHSSIFKEKSPSYTFNPRNPHTLFI